jgi:hypothetical protein
MNRRDSSGFSQEDLELIRAERCTGTVRRKKVNAASDRRQNLSLESQ